MPTQPENVNVLKMILSRMVEKSTAVNLQGVSAVAVLDSNKTIQLMTADCGKMFSPGCNYVALACSKIAEMADTLKDSGSNVRPAAHGEFGYTGGTLKAKGDIHYLAAFSGAKGEEDLEIAKYGLEIV